MEHWWCEGSQKCSCILLNNISFLWLKLMPIDMIILHFNDHIMLDDNGIFATLACSDAM